MTLGYRAENPRVSLDYMILTLQEQIIRETAAPISGCLIPDSATRPSCAEWAPLQSMVAKIAVCSCDILG